MAPTAPSALPLSLLKDAHAALVRTVDALSDDAYAAPSLLPGWTRAHVVAHLALNAEGLAGVVAGARAGSAVAMYASESARDDDIAGLAAAAPRTLRDRLLGAVTDVESALSALRDLPDDVLAVPFERTPGSGPRGCVGDVAALRLCEAELHQVDLDAGRRPSDWSREFAGFLLELSARNRGGAASLTAHATDLDARWTFGEDGVGPEVSGRACDLGWWLTGRGDGDGLTSDSGVLPSIPPW